MSLRRSIGVTWLAFWLLPAFAATGSGGVATPPRESRAVRLEGFDLEQVDRLAEGVALRFSVYGSPQGNVVLHIQGGRRPLVLGETEPGVYEGTYVLTPDDDVRPDSAVVATLRRGNEVARLPLDEPLVLTRAPPPWETAGPSPSPPPPPPRIAQAEPAAPVRDICDDCAVVESIRAVAVAPSGGLVGALSGTFAGSVLRHVLERSHLREYRYDVVLRRPDGSTLQRRYEKEPAFTTGDRLRLSGSGSSATTATTATPRR